MRAGDKTVNQDVTSANRDDLNRSVSRAAENGLANLSNGQKQLTGLARIERYMADRFAERADGWPVGSELRGYRAWSCASPTVQLVEMPLLRGPERFVVLTLFPFLRIDRRYRPSDPMRLHTARRYAFARLRTLSHDGEIRFSNKPGIELCRGGDHFGLEVRL